MSKIKVQYIDYDDYVIVKLLHIPKSVIVFISNGTDCYHSKIFGEVYIQWTHHIYFLPHSKDDNTTYIAFGNEEINNKHILIEKGEYTYDNIVVCFNDILLYLSEKSNKQ